MLDPVTVGTTLTHCFFMLFASPFAAVDAGFITQHSAVRDTSAPQTTETSDLDALNTNDEAPDQEADNEADEAPDEAPNEASNESPDEAPDAQAAQVIQPERVAGTYLGGALSTTITSTRLSGFPSAPPLYGFSLSADAGSVVFPWMSIGFSLVGGNGYADQDGTPLKSTIAGLLTDIAFYPKPGIPLSLRVGFGAGFGRLEETRASSGLPGAEPSSQVFGGALFQGIVRYTFFPGARKRRPRKNGGLALGPQVSWLGHTPSERGASMANTVVLGLWTGFFRGNP